MHELGEGPSGPTRVTLDGVSVRTDSNCRQVRGATLRVMTLLTDLDSQAPEEPRIFRAGRVRSVTTGSKNYDLGRVSLASSGL